MACFATHICHKLFHPASCNNLAKVLPHQIVRHGGSVFRVQKQVRYGPRKPPGFHIPIPPLLYNEDYTFKETDEIRMPEEFRHVYPDFIPDPDSEYRNRMREKLERRDMYARRCHIDIPEFYVGSILAVTLSDPNATGKLNRFLGICIDRGGWGLRSWFILRNCIDNLGIEINYELYCPLITSIELIRLEKRIDPHLYYLRDAKHEYSTFPLDMDPEPLTNTAEVPLNKVKVVLKPKPWQERWEQKELKGLILPNMPLYLAAKKEFSSKPWEKYDLMKEYRATIPEEEQKFIYREMLPYLPKYEAVRRRAKRVKMVTEKKV